MVLQYIQHAQTASVKLPVLCCARGDPPWSVMAPGGFGGATSGPAQQILATTLTGRAKGRDFIKFLSKGRVSDGRVGDYGDDVGSCVGVSVRGLRDSPRVGSRASPVGALSFPSSALFQPFRPANSPIPHKLAHSFNHSHCLPSLTTSDTCDNTRLIPNGTAEHSRLKGLTVWQPYRRESTAATVVEGSWRPTARRRSLS